MPLEIKYFVLKPKSKFFNDPYAAASRKAMRIYADMIKNEDKELSESLMDWVKKETNRNIEFDEA